MNSISFILMPLHRRLSQNVGWKDDGSHVCSS